MPKHFDSYCFVVYNVFVFGITNFKISNSKYRIYYSALKKICQAGGEKMSQKSHNFEKNMVTVDDMKVFITAAIRLLGIYYKDEPCEEREEKIAMCYEVMRQADIKIAELNAAGRSA